MQGDFMPAPNRTKSLPVEPTPPVEEQKPNNQPTFQTPDQVSVEAEQGSAAPLLADTAELQSPPPQDDSSSNQQKASWKTRLTPHWPPGIKEISAAVILLLVLGGGAFAVFHKPSKPTPAAAIVHVAPAPKPKVVVPTTVASNLSGLQVDPSINARPVTAVMIENSDAARPQSGLSQAGVVFEAVAEGGVTRFMALYQDNQPASLGPIRSARPYYISWALGFDAGYAHVGGSPDGLADIKSWGVRDLDEFYNGGSYMRITTREAPHNVYTSMLKLNQLEASKGYTSSTYTSWARKADSPAKVPTARVINVSLSGADYNSQYTYNPTTNSYLRDEAGAPQIDQNTNAQLSPKVVITIVVPETRGALDSSGAYYSDYNPIGSGVADIFQDGTETTGTWSKAANTTQITFADSTGKPLPLNAGQTWITAIQNGGVKFTP